MDPFRDPPTDLDRPFVLVAMSGTVLGVHRRTGEVSWEASFTYQSSAAVALAFRHGVLVVSTDDRMVYRLDYLSGQILWSAMAGEAGAATIVIEPELIVVAKNGELDAFDLDGTPLWHQNLPKTRRGDAILAFPGNVASGRGL